MKYHLPLKRIFTLLLDKDAIELAEYHHEIQKRSFLTILVVFSKGHQLIENPNAEFNTTTGSKQVFLVWLKTNRLTCGRC